MIYHDNKQVITEYKNLTKREGYTLTKIAGMCNLKPQELNDRFSRNKRLPLSDLNQWLNVIGYDLEINFIKRQDFQNTTQPTQPTQTEQQQK